MYRDTERNGAYIDIPKLREVREKYKNVEKEKLDWLNSKYSINWNSSAQVSDVLFSEDKEGCPILKKSDKTGKPSADAEVLNKLAAKGYDIPKVLLEYKSANTLNKMFLNRWEDDLGFDKRIHPSFNLTNVVTGRTSCQNPNLQQVPREKDVRGLFSAPTGRCFFEADYSQLELRIAAEYSKDPVMMSIYKSGGDIHSTTAKLMTGGREPTKEERSKAKAVNFGRP
jgi:DNA polymerase I-like protein with 3'-5' exonuclease and polymerase domains